MLKSATMHFKECASLQCRRVLTGCCLLKTAMSQENASLGIDDDTEAMGEDEVKQEQADCAQLSCTYLGARMKLRVYGGLHWILQVQEYCTDLRHAHYGEWGLKAF